MYVHRYNTACARRSASTVCTTVQVHQCKDPLSGPANYLCSTYSTVLYSTVRCFACQLNTARPVLARGKLPEMIRSSTMEILEWPTIQRRLTVSLIASVQGFEEVTFTSPDRSDTSAFRSREEGLCGIVLRLVVSPFSHAVKTSGTSSGRPVLGVFAACSHVAELAMNI